MTVSLLRRLSEFELSLITTELSRVEIAIGGNSIPFPGKYLEMFRFLKVDFPEEILATLS